MSKMSSSDYYYWLKRIDNAKTTSELEVIRMALLSEFDSDDDQVNELIKKLRR